jgi:molecular chaperone GrpE
MKPTDADPADLDLDPSGADAPPEREDLEARLRAAEARAEELRNAHLRTAAELENYRRRVARELESARQYGSERLAAGLLPVVDSLELGLTNADRSDAATLVEGQKATLRLLLKALQESGIVEVDPVGEPFDPERHEAMAMQPSNDQAPDTVLAVVQKGYILNGRLLRPARVIVARAPDA